MDWVVLPLFWSKAIVGFEQSILHKGETHALIAFADFIGINVSSRANMIFLDAELKENVQQQTIEVYLLHITTKGRCNGP